MANTYTQIHIQVVFAVKYRRALLGDVWRNDLFKYMNGIVMNNGHRPLAINGPHDHVHVFFGMRPSQSLSELMQNLKGASSKWINDMSLTKRRFQWQEGYGAFSYAQTAVPAVISYIRNQEEHHKKEGFLQEYRSMLDVHEVDYDQRYLFMPLE